MTSESGTDRHTWDARRAEGLVRLGVEVDELGCSGCGEVVDFSDAGTMDEVLRRMDDHRQQHDDSPTVLPDGGTDSTGNARGGTTFWRSEKEECPECGSKKVFTDGESRWCGPCGWRENVESEDHDETEVRTDGGRPSTGIGRFRGHESDTDVWCKEGHPPKLVQKREGYDQHYCPECGLIYKIQTEVRQTNRSVDTGIDRDRGQIHPIGWAALAVVFVIFLAVSLAIAGGWLG